MRKINRVVIHCSATRREWMEDTSVADQAAEIDRWHKARGWRAIGYHFVIGRDGAVAYGRDIDEAGAHVRGHNHDSIGICLIGGHGSSAEDAFETHFTIEQDTALRELLAALMLVLGPMKVHGHNEFAAKACPGFQVQPHLAK